MSTTRKRRREGADAMGWDIFLRFGTLHGMGVRSEPLFILRFLACPIARVERSESRERQ